MQGRISLTEEVNLIRAYRFFTDNDELILKVLLTWAGFDTRYDHPTHDITLINTYSAL